MWAEETGCTRINPVRQRTVRFSICDLMIDMSDGKHGQGESGGETPSLADHSGNNTPAGTRKTKVGTP